LGRTFGVTGLTDNEGQVAVRALKKAEDDDTYVLRVQELEGRSADKFIKFMVPFQTVKEINAAEEPMTQGAELQFTPNGLQVRLKPYQTRTLAFRFGKTFGSRITGGPSLPFDGAATTGTIPLRLPFNRDGVS